MMSKMSDSHVLRVENDALSIVLSTTHGLGLLALVDRTSGHDFIVSDREDQRGVSVFEAAFAGDNSDDLIVLSSLGGFAVTRVDFPAPDSLQVELSGIGVPVKATLSISLDSRLPQGTWRLGLRHAWSTERSMRVTYPLLKNVSVSGGSNQVMGCVPMEIGTARPLGADDRLGMKPGGRFMSPSGMNFLEFACLYSPDEKGGVYCACPDGWPEPVQLRASRDAIEGIWTGCGIPADSSIDLPPILIGVQSHSDWRQSIDVSIPSTLREHRDPHATAPTWIRECGALYACSGEGAGGIYQTLPTVSIKERIGHFDALPKLLDEAEQLGCRVIYLYDYWEGTSEGGRPPYWNKGDYRARSDMGGAEALRRGIARLHERGARVIVYLEPFIVYRYSELGRTKAMEWAAHDPNGTPYAHYVDNYTMCVAHPSWQEHVVQLARRMVREWDVDGIYLDSTGWQWNWVTKIPGGDRIYTRGEWNQGMIDLVDRVRECAREIKSDAVVLTESMCAPLAAHVDGGLDASFAWHHDLNAGRLLDSPARFAFPGLNFFSGGRNLNQLNQVFAAGHGLALSYHLLEHAGHVRKLVEARNKLKDALIYGRQTYRPNTGDPNVSSYYYLGSRQTVVTVVNTSKETYDGHLVLRRDHGGEKWTDVYSGQTKIARPDGQSVRLPVTVPPEGVSILLSI